MVIDFYSNLNRLNFCLEGKCGVCGDSYTGPRDHELGGKYATNTIVRSYAMNSMIDVKILVKKTESNLFSKSFLLLSTS